MQNLWYHSCELTFQFVKLFAFAAAVVLPATWVSVRRIPDLSVAARVGIGAAAGFALFIITAWYCGTWSLDYLVGAWTVQFPIAAWLGRTTGNGKSAKADGHKSGALEQDKTRSPARGRFHDQRNPAVGGTSHGWPILFLPLAVIVLQLYALEFSILPQGVDASFHCVVARRQLDENKVTTNLWPLEAVELNYPVGSHLWLAVASQWTGLAIHEVFRHTFAIVLGGCALVIAAWAERLFGSVLHGIAGAFAFVFCTPHVSLFPYTWGGLPALMAMWLGMGGLFCVMQVPGRVGLVSGAVLLASCAMVNHHTMVALLGGSVLVAGIGWLAQPANRGPWRRSLVALAAAGLLAGVYVIPLVTRVGKLSQTSIASYAEPFGWPWEQFWTWNDDRLSFWLTLLSALVTSIALILGFRFRPRLPSTGSRAMLLGLVCVWLLSFCMLDYGGRLLALALKRPASQPFTPSRFVFDAQFILAVFAAAGLVRVWEWLKRPAFQFAVVSALACAAILQSEPRWQPKPDDDLLHIGQWADSHVPAESLITGSNSVWVTYAFHRESTSLFVPISEIVEPNRRRLKSALERNPVSLTPSQWQQALGKAIYLIGYAADPNAPASPLVSSGSYGLYEWKW